MDLTRLIRDVPDWPKPGIVFKDITPLLRDPAGLSAALEAMAAPFRNDGIEVVAAAESRGFIFGTAIAQSLGAGFVPVRKPGKLPRETVDRAFALEYGEDRVELHRDAIRGGERVLLVDDLLATGGTLKACCELVDELGGTVAGVTMLVELAFLGGRSALSPCERVNTVLTTDESGALRHA